MNIEEEFKKLNTADEEIRSIRDKRSHMEEQLDEVNRQLTNAVRDAKGIEWRISKYLNDIKNTAGSRYDRYLKPAPPEPTGDFQIVLPTKLTAPEPTGDFQIVLPTKLTANATASAMTNSIGWLQNK